MNKKHSNEKKSILLRCYTALQQFFQSVQTFFKNTWNWIRNGFKSPSKTEMNQSAPVIAPSSTVTVVQTIIEQQIAPVNAVITPNIQPQAPKLDEHPKAEAPSEEQPEKKVEIQRQKTEAGQQQALQAQAAATRAEAERQKQATQAAEAKRQREAAIEFRRAKKIERAKQQKREAIRKAQQQEYQAKLIAESEKLLAERREEAQAKEAREKAEAEKATQDAKIEAEAAREARFKAAAEQAAIEKKQSLEAQAKKQAETKFMTDLDCAITKNDIESVKKLLSNNTRTLPIELLTASIKNNQADIARLLIKHIKEDINVKTTINNFYVKLPLWDHYRSQTFGEEALLYATANGHTDIVRFLLDQSITIINTNQLIENLPLVNPSDYSSQYTADSKKILDIFFEKKIKVLYRQGKAISYAVQSGAVDALQYILDTTALKNTPAKDYRNLIYDMQTYPSEWINTGTSSNAIEYAIKEHQPKVAEFLLTYFKERNHKNRHSTSMLCSSYSDSKVFYYALQHGEMDIAKMLFPYLNAADLNKPPPVSKKDNTHRTALFYAIQKQDPEMVQMLVDRGASYGPLPYPAADIKIIENFSNTFFLRPLAEVGINRDVASVISDYVISQKPRALENPEAQPATPTSPKKNK